MTAFAILALAILTLHPALFALRCAFNACPSEEGRNAIQQQAHQLQEQHQQAQYTAAACQEACEARRGL